MAAVAQAPDTTLTPEGLTWTSERLTSLGAAIYKLIQGYTDKAIVVTSELLSWVTHFTLQVRWGAHITVSILALKFLPASWMVCACCDCHPQCIVYPQYVSRIRKTEKNRKDLPFRTILDRECTLATVAAPMLFFSTSLWALN